MSVGLPVYNGGRYLREAVESVLAQDLEDYEPILCDNASTDATEGICREYAARDPRVRYERADENRGAAWNYNRAVGLARGTYFRWQPYDDRIAPTCLSRCLAELEERGPGVVLAYPKTLLMDAEGESLGEYEDRTECLSPRPHERIRSLLRNLVLCNAVLGVTRLEVLRSTRLMGSWQASDKTLLLELALRGCIVEVPERLFFRRRDRRLPSPSNMDGARRSVWFDPERPVGRYRWPLVREAFRAVSKSPLGPSARARCHLTVLRDAIRYRRALARELAGGLKNGRNRDDTSGDP